MEDVTLRYAIKIDAERTETAEQRGCEGDPVAYVCTQGMVFVRNIKRIQKGIFKKLKIPSLF